MAPNLQTFNPSTTDAQKQQCVLSTRCTAAIHHRSLDSTFQTHDHFHLERQGQQINGKTTTCKFPFKPLIILTWKYIAVPSQSLGQNPGIPSLTALWVNPQHMDCSNSRRQLTTTFSRSTRDGQSMLASQRCPCPMNEFKKDMGENVQTSGLILA